MAWASLRKAGCRLLDPSAALKATYGVSPTPGWHLQIITRKSQFASGFSMPTPKKLNEIVNVEGLQACTPEEIKKTWNDAHIGRSHISTTLSSQQYDGLCFRAQSCPMFVLPVLREKGFVSMLTQAQMPHLLFTGLEDYKVRGTEAAPFFVVTHYPDLAESKEIVLVRGDVVLPSRLSDDEARELLKNIHDYYLDDGRYRHVKTFNKESREFDYREVLKDLRVTGG
eukprot:jgi/Mesen1/4600/ME000232S03844